MNKKLYKNIKLKSFKISLKTLNQHNTKIKIIMLNYNLE